MKITFVFDGVTYSVGMEAYNRNLPIKLPNGTVLEVIDGWFETLPPSPFELKVVENTSPEVALAEVAG